MKISAFAAMLAMTGHGGALAAEMGAPAPPAPAAEDRSAVAAKLVIAMGFEQQFDAMIPQIISMIMPMMMQGNVGKEDQVRTILMEEMVAAFHGRRSDFIANARDVYARNFSTAELDAMLVFYTSPIGRAVTTKLPQVGLEAMKGGGLVGQKAAQDALPRIYGRMQAAQLSVPKGT